MNQRQNLMNLSRDLNLRRGSIWLVPLKIVFKVSRFKPHSIETVSGGFETRLKFIKFGRRAKVYKHVKNTFYLKVKGTNYF